MGNGIDDTLISKHSPLIEDVVRKLTDGYIEQELHEQGYLISLNSLRETKDQHNKEGHFDPAYS
jgi:hypothetical protein